MRESTLCDSIVRKPWAFLCADGQGQTPWSVFISRMLPLRCKCDFKASLSSFFFFVEDLQYSGSHVTFPALKLHYQQLSWLSIAHTHARARPRTYTPTHTLPPFILFFLYLLSSYAHWIAFKFMKQSAKCLNVTTLSQWKYCGKNLVLNLSLLPKKLIHKSL